MVLAVVQGVKIAGIGASVPRQRHSYLENSAPFDADEAKKLVESIGVRERRILPPHLCASDMCLYAAQDLLQRLDWAPDSVDVLIFVSQDSDYALPATACVMQRHLGLAQSAAAFDVNLGCSGFVYAVWMAAQLLSGMDGRRALVMAGDTSSRHLMPDDRATLPLFGDAGGVAALEKADDAGPMHVALGTDGRGAPHIFVKAGGRRDTLVPEADPPSAAEHERLYRDARLHMNGVEVFGFSLRVVPKLLAEVTEAAGLTLDDIDMCVMHQANRFMLEHLRKKSKIAPERFLIEMAEYGNTSSASIPLAISHGLSERLAGERLKLLLAGFGVGWSWGALICDVGPIAAPRVVEMPDDVEPLKVA